MSDETMAGEERSMASLVAALKEVAEGGHPEAQYRLGLLHAQGKELPLDYSAAAAWFGRAAEQGFREAQRELGWLYANGFGVAQDDTRAHACYRAAAEAGDARSQYLLGLDLQRRRPADAEETATMLRWYQAAAEQGYMPAQYALGKLLADGELAPRNDEAAFRWLSLAIMHGSESGKEALAMLSARLDEEVLAAYKARMLEAMQSDSDGG